MDSVPLVTLSLVPTCIFSGEWVVRIGPMRGVRSDFEILAVISVQSDQALRYKQGFHETPSCFFNVRGGMTTINRGRQQGMV